MGSAVQPLASAVQPVGAALPAQLAYTGTGWWPILWSVLALFAGFVLLRLRKVQPTVARI